MGKRCGLASGYVLEGTVMVSQSDLITKCYCNSVTIKKIYIFSLKNNSLEFQPEEQNENNRTPFKQKNKYSPVHEKDIFSDAVSPKGTFSDYDILARIFIFYMSDKNYNTEPLISPFRCN